MAERIPFEALITYKDQYRFFVNIVRALSHFAGEIYVIFKPMPDGITLYAETPDMWVALARIPYFFFGEYRYAEEPRVIAADSEKFATQVSRFDGLEDVTIRTDIGEIELEAKIPYVKRFRFKFWEVEEEEKERILGVRLPTYTELASLVLHDFRTVAADLTRALTAPREVLYDVGGLKTVERWTLTSSYARKEWVFGEYVYIEQATGPDVSLLKLPPYDLNVRFAEEGYRVASGFARSLGRFFGKEMALTLGRDERALFLATKKFDIEIVASFSVEYPDVFPWEVPYTPVQQFAIKVYGLWDDTDTRVAKAYAERKIEWEEMDSIREWLRTELRGLKDDIGREILTVEEALEQAKKLCDEALIKAKVKVPPPVIVPPMVRKWGREGYTYEVDEEKMRFRILYNEKVVRDWTDLTLSLEELADMLRQEGWTEVK